MEATLAAVAERMDNAATTAKASGTFIKEPSLVAVSKTKSVEAILEAYGAGQRIFGENYVQELVTKANDERLPKDIQWHFIGTLQSNKAKQIAPISNLALIETISSTKLANILEKIFSTTVSRPEPLPVLVQVNTSGEENKGGVHPDGTQALVHHIMENCPHLCFAGLMTIGEYGWAPASANDFNPDFVRLVEVRDSLCAAMELNVEDVEISMGMSADYEHAIELGATIVRVGSTIFGARQYKN